MCGWQLAVKVSPTRQVGLVITRRVEDVVGRLCKGCGQSAYRIMTNRTLLTGWWGFLVLLLRELRIHRKEPSRRAQTPEAGPSPRAADRQGRPAPWTVDPDKPLSRRIGPWLAGLAALLLLGVGISAALSTAQRSDGGEISRGGTLDVMELQEGDRFNDPQEGTDEVEILQVEAVVCGEPHDNEVFKTGSVTDAETYPGNQTLFEQVGLDCLADFEAFVGVPYRNSVLDFAVLTPTASSWEEGDRGYVCAIYDPTGPVEGSLRGANR